jgi:hypothetical protein
MVKASYKLSNGQGAVLTMDRDITNAMDSSTLCPLLKEKSMRNMLVVSQVHSCASYARYLSTEAARGVKIELEIKPLSGDAQESANVQREWNATRSLATSRHTQMPTESARTTRSFNLSRSRGATW